MKIHYGNHNTRENMDFLDWLNRQGFARLARMVRKGLKESKDYYEDLL